jgi:hypothetical protein
MLIFRPPTFLAFYLLMTSQSVVAYVANNSDANLFKDKSIFVGQRVIRPDLTKDSSLHGLITVGLMQVNTIDVDAPTDEFVTSSLQFVTDHPDYFGQVESTDLLLDKSSILKNRSEQFFKFRVRRDGLLIEDAHIDFRYKFGQLIQVINYSFHEAERDMRAVKKNLKEDLSRKIGIEPIRHLNRIYRAVPTKEGYRLIKVDVFELRRNNDVYKAQVESATGRVFQVKPLKYYAQGKAHGQIYLRYYKDSLSDGAFPFLNLNLTSGTARTDAEGIFVANSGSSPRISGYKGSFVNIRASTGTLISGTASESQGIFDLNISKDPSTQSHADKMMSQTMIYYHVNKVIAEAKNFISGSWLNATLTANANLDSTCNAHWDGSTINFYSADSRCANTGSISDVIYHEWGHGLDDAFGGIEDGAFSEGFGDIVGLTMTGSNILGPGFKLDGGFVRDLEPDKKYPQDRGQVHAEGLIIGGAMYDLYKELVTNHGEASARQILKKLAFKMITTASTYLEVYNALLAIDDNDGNLANGTPNACAINKNFAVHGLATVNPALCSNPTPTPTPLPSPTATPFPTRTPMPSPTATPTVPPNPTPSPTPTPRPTQTPTHLPTPPAMGNIGELVFEEFVGNPNRILEPGESAAVYTTFINDTLRTEFGLRASGVVYPPVPGISLSDELLEWDTVPGGTTRITKNAIELIIGSDVACDQQFTIRWTIRSDDRMTYAARNMIVRCLL